MDKLITETFGLLAAIVGVAILAVIVSRNANTTGVLKAAGDAFSGALAAATGPVSGGSRFSAGVGGGVF
jgi:Flp pilus assembly pilin Flp